MIRFLHEFRVFLLRARVYVYVDLQVRYCSNFGRIYVYMDAKIVDFVFYL